MTGTGNEILSIPKMAQQAPVILPRIVSGATSPYLCKQVSIMKPL